MLYSYTAAAGPQAGRTLILPYSQVQHRPTSQRQQSVITLAKAHGVILANGGTMALLDWASIAADFIITENWLKTQNYPTGIAGVETFLYDMNEVLLQGGLGTLVDKLVSGVKHGLNGATVTQRVCTCTVTGTSQPERRDGGTSVVWTLELMNPSGFWTSSDATWQPVY